MSAATITLLFLLFAVVMFVFEKIPLGVTSMIVCVGLVVTGVLDVKTAFAGFINSNVILFVAMFIVGGALFETGMANKIGGIVTHFAKSERSLIVAIMVIVGLMSGVLSNTGTAAVLIPVVIGIAAKSGYARSKLLMPLVFAAAMGGNLSLIGAPGNLIAQSALGEIGMSFGFFEYARSGLPAGRGGRHIHRLYRHGAEPRCDSHRQYPFHRGRRLGGCAERGSPDVRLSDVADVEVIDNAADSYTRLNGEQASVLKIYKDDSSSAGDVSANCLDAFKELEAQYDGLHIVVLSNQGNYISILIKSILTSMLVGAALAVVVLAIFLKDVKPTLVVGVSIPLSVLCAVVLMYFTGLDLNVMTLAGLSLGIGMLVDNSVVVIENIYRLRGRGVPAARAAVQGARQVGMSVVASTLTSVCVFLPAVFSASLIRNLMGPMSLCIGYCLMASLIVALTVVPAASATVLKNAQPKKLAWFDKIQDAYGRSLEKALKNRFIPLAAAVLLLVFCCWRVVSMGIVLLPTSTSNEAMITLSTTDTLSKDESYDVAGKVVQAVMAVDGVEEVGITPDNTVAGMDVSNLGLPSTITDLLNAANGYGKYKINVKLNEELSSSKIDAACKAMEDAVAGVADCTATVQQYGMTDDLTSQLSTGLTIKIYGTDAETLTALSEKVMDIVNSTDGFQNATNGLGAGDSTIILQVDRDKVRAYGLTVAQVYQQIAAKLTTTTTAQTPVTVDGTTMDVQISNNLDPLTKENMMDMTFETTVMSADGTTATGTCKLSDIASWTTGNAPDSITSENQNQFVTVTAETAPGYNTTVQARAVKKALDAFALTDEMPEGCSFSMGGESDSVNYMTDEMIQWMALALPFVYLVMVAQFQSLLSPFIVLFTVPLAFTGGLLGLLLTGQQLTMISMMGFIVLMGTVVNNGIVFVDYANQLRMGGMERRAALVATGKTRMRPILMTTLTTVLAMLQMVFSNDMASQLMSGMAIVIICGLSYATLMTLYIVPILYDILFKKPPLNVDIGSDEDLDDIPDDAAEFIAAQSSAAQPQPEA